MINLDKEELQTHRENFKLELEEKIKTNRKEFDEMMSEYCKDLAPIDRQVVFNDSQRVTNQLEDNKCKDITMSKEYFLQVTSSMQNITNYFMCKTLDAKIKG